MVLEDPGQIRVWDLFLSLIELTIIMARGEGKLYLLSPFGSYSCYHNNNPNI